MWYVYILYSSKIDRFYTGVTENVAWRLERHNMGWGRYTKRGIPWELKYFKFFVPKSFMVSTPSEGIHTMYRFPDYKFQNRKQIPNKPN